MGYIGLLITVLIMILGAGYFFLGGHGALMTVNNDSTKAPIVQELNQAKTALDAAKDAKNLVEQKAAETMRAPDEPTAVKETTKVPDASATQKTGDLKIVNHLLSAGFSVPSKQRSIDTIVIHSSYDAIGSDPYSVSGVIKEYTDAGVSAHYLIGRDGTIYRLVADKNIAYHAGVSKMSDGRTNVNDFSIGIEMINTKEGKYADEQYEAVNNLITYLKGKYSIKNIVGHDDIAPGRKTDPWNFDWKRVK